MSMEELDEIPWHSLHHAYGHADDVPELIRRLQNVPHDSHSPESALSELFSNIWHQGTVCEATSYVVPFLIRLVADPATPDRVGILQLLEAIAHGTSYLDVHEEILPNRRIPKLGAPSKAEFEHKKALELEWVARSHSAVAAGFQTFFDMAGERTEVAYAAASVLARIPERARQILPLLHEMHSGETRALYRAGLLLLMAQLAEDWGALRELLSSAARAESVVERRAAALAAARLQKSELDGDLRRALVDAMCDEDLTSHFDELPWDVNDSVNECRLLERSDAEISEAAGRLLAAVEGGHAGAEAYRTLCEILFERKNSHARSLYRYQELTALQRQTIQAIVMAIDEDNRFLGICFSQYGLPDTRRELRNLVAGRPPTPVDMTLPLIGDADRPARPRSIGSIRCGDRIHHRHLGLGSITDVRERDNAIELDVEFDEEGKARLRVTNSKATFVADMIRYVSRRIRESLRRN
ncbi:MAG: hypothetical protein R3C10_08125 [Pirellulales bacterium]